VWKDFLGKKENRRLTVALDATTEIIDHPPPSTIQKMMISSKPTMTMLKSKFSKSLVVKFLLQLSQAPNRTSFLDTYPEERPGVIGPIESFLVDIMKKKKTGYYMRPDKIEKATVEKSVYNTGC
jgi:hypothetical protein